MNIAVNTRLLLKGKLEGIGWFSYETLKRITLSHPEHTFYFIFDRDYDRDFVFSDNVIPVVAGPQARHPLLFYLWFEYSIPYILKKVKADLFFSPDGYLSLSTGVKSVAVIHDLNFEHYPGDLPFLIRRYYRHFFPKFAARALRLATVSEYSKKDICSLYKTDPGKIDVVYNGANESFAPLKGEEKQAIAEKYSEGVPYFVFVGSLHPRKNLHNLFRAYDLFRQSSGQNIKLVIVGAKKWWTKEIRQAYESMKFRGDVVFTGRVDEKELGLITGSALAMTYVSTFEGFGIPIVEAFASGVPVITSNVTSMPEVAGNAALLADPFSVEDIAAAMNEIATNKNLRETMIKAGLEQGGKFSWDKTAALLWKTIEKALNNNL